MLKIALVTAGAIAAGTTAYVVHRTTRAPAPTPAVAAAAPREAAPTPPAAARAAAPARIATGTPPALPAAPPRPPGATVTADPDEAPIVDRATVARLKLDQGPSRGPVAAPVTIVVFTDMQCTYCGQVLGTVDQLWDDYPNKLRLVVKQFPVHQTARLAAEAALAAQAQGKFWELHDLMMANQADLSHDALLDLGRQAGLDVDALRTALDQHLFADALAADEEAGREIDVTGTPAFLINGRRFVGARPLDEFRAAIDQALAEAGQAP